MKRHNQYCKIARTYFGIYGEKHNDSIEEMNKWLKENGYTIQFPSFESASEHKKYKWTFIAYSQIVKPCQQI